jgi:hypothetical protein
MKQNEEFEELSIPRKELPRLANHYRVYKDEKDYITVEAESALEALNKSGLHKAHRIERNAIFLANVLNLEALSNRPASVAKEAVETPAAEASAPVTPETQQPAAEAVAATPATDTPAVAAEAPLSNSDVDKLLKGENTTGA